MREAGLLTSNLRNPRLTVISDGKVLPNVLKAEISNTAHFVGGRFSLTLAIDALAATTLVQAGDILDLQMSLGGDPTSLIQGEADRVSIDVIGRTAVIEGRDLTGRLIDSKTQESFSNQTASEIAETLAARHGLAANVQATTTLAGRYYSNEHQRITLAQFSRATTEWDLLSFLAAREGFDVFVSGKTLNFVPQQTSLAGYTLAPAMCMSLHLDHSLTLARDIEVSVKSWNTRQQAAFTQSVRSTGQSSRGGQPLHIVVVRPNLGPNEALELAQRILEDLSAHERVVRAEIPRELFLTARSVVALIGTGTDFDQSYYVAELNRHFDCDSGYVESIVLKNLRSTEVGGGSTNIQH